MKLHLSKNSLAFALLLAVPTSQAQFPEFNVDNLIPQWLPQCFDGMNEVNPLEVMDCIRGNSQASCMEKNFEETVMDVIQCVNISISDEVTEFFESFNQDGDLTATSKQGDGNPFSDFINEALGIDTEGLFNLGTVFVNASLECLDPYVDCVNQTIHEAINTKLQPCINQTLRELIDCGRDNSETCIETCNNTQLETNLEGLDFMAVQTCGGIQTNIMDPLCSVVSCCEPCVAKMEALMQCIVNEQLEQVPAVGETCESLVCPAASQRHLLRQETRLLEAKQTNPTEQECLQYSPGLTGDDGKEFSARSAVFVPCVSESFLGAVQKAAAEESIPEGAKDENSAAGVRAFGSVSLVTMMAVASLVL